MALQTITSPALKTGAAASITTDAFNAPAQSLLVAAWSGSASSPAIAGGSLTWTSRAAHSSGHARIWTAPCPTAKTGMTVALSVAGFAYGGLKAWVVTGAVLAAPVGASNTGASSTDPTTISGYSSTASGSLGFCAAYENNIAGNPGVLPTSSDVAEGFSMKDVYGTAGSGLAIRKAAPVGAAGQSVTFNADAPAGIQTPSWEWAALEILAADAGPPTVPGNLRVTEVTGTTLTVAWDPSTDDIGVTGYGVYLDGAKVAGP
ncbi:fibronectin type III domain-containing protein [Nonomuraea sp. NPDC005650]|uniref:fibronectin type III domain-containing protein n=1 Tax=Nonomuraea sp. NPDC005650 TaxID=3157045 RepID=UPI0033AF20A8